MSQHVGDADAWQPPRWGRDVAAKALGNLATLHTYAVACGEQDALREVLRSCEGLPVDLDAELVRAGLDLVEQSLQLGLPPHYTDTAA